MNIIQMDQAYVAPTYARFPVALVKGKGSLAWDADGKQYIDLGAGIAVNSFGYSDPEWIAAVTEQLGTLQHSSNLYYTEPCAKLAKMLCERTGMKKVFYSNSGAESNECGIKAARKYACDKKGSEYYTIVTLENSFHGRTLTTLAATGQDAFHEYFQPLTPGFVSIPATVEALEQVVKDYKVAAFMFETVRGEGGVLPMEPEFAEALKRISKAEDILLYVDEVQTGNGRTGKLYGYMHYGMEPDIVTTAKGIGGGLPIGITMLGEKVENVFTPGLNGSTFGGNPVCCAGAVNILSRMDDAILASVAEKSEYIVKELTGAPGVESVTGLGLILGVKPVKPAKEVVAKCLEKGVLALTAKDKVRLLPALNIPMEELKQAVAVLKMACAE